MDSIVESSVSRSHDRILSLHHYCGLLAGAFILILAITGPVMAFSTEIDRFLHPSLLHVSPQQSTLSLTSIIAKVSAVLHAGEHVEICVIPTDRTLPYAFTVFGSGLLPHQIFADQYTGQVRGTLSVVRFVPIMGKLHSASDVLTGLAAIALVLQVALGCVLWWRRRGTSVGSGSSSKNTSYDFHNALGIIFSVFFVCFGLTGVFMAFEDWTVPAAYTLTGTKVLPMSPTSAVVSGANSISPDQARDAAQASLPGAIALWIVLPQEPTKSYVVKMKFPEDHSVGGTSIVWIDQYSGKALSVWNSRTAPAGRKIETFVKALHSGEILGVAGRALACVVSLVLAMQVITGAHMWWRRRRISRTL